MTHPRPFSDLWDDDTDPEAAAEARARTLASWTPGDDEVPEPTEREVRLLVGECPDHSDHDTHWLDDDQGYCRNCGAEFIDEDAS